MNLIGRKFGRLKVIEKSEDYITPNGTKFHQWLCECRCGNKVIVNQYSLLRDLTKSCGCLNKELTKERNISCKKCNTYDLSGEYGIGYTSNTNEPFYFDLEDYDKIKDYCWSIRKDGYVYARDSNNNVIKMHNVVMNFKSDVDHIHHKKYDNRKSELRIVTRSQNQMNVGLCKNNTSGVTGVCFEKSIKRWSAYITVNRKQIKLGRFKKFEDAVKARKEAEEKYFGEYSYDNSMKVGDINDSH